ncbi:MAG: 7-cyano-7-deazaguanine synthase QueC [Spirochaetota bacterium]
MKKALVLFSGGLDSTTCLYLARRDNDEVHTVSFHYSQKHSIELEKAKAITTKLSIPHHIIRLDPTVFSGSSLTDASISVPKNQLQSEEIPNTYVPGRNILFLSYACSLAESKGIAKIYIGVNALDYSGYPDCRPEFIATFAKAIALGTKQGQQEGSLQIETPLVDMSKKDIVLLGKELQVPFGMTHSCYDPIDGKPCGQCDSCLLRAKGFAEAGVMDE